MTAKLPRALAALGLACALAGPRTACAAPQEDLRAKVAELEARLQRQEDIEAVRRVAFSYGDYMDNALMGQVESLFSDHVDYCEIAGYGLYRGHAGCMKIWQEILGPGMQNADGHQRFGRLIKHYLVKDIITIDPDGRHAEGRFDYIGYSGIFGQPEHTTQQLGVYRMGFVKEDGVWKIGRFNLSFDTSDWNYSTWATQTNVRCPRPGAPKPDGAFMMHHPFPEAAIIPFNQPNPVTGKPVPNYVNPHHYWQGNWPDDPDGACGHVPGAAGGLEPSRSTPSEGPAR